MGWWETPPKSILEYDLADNCDIVFHYNSSKVTVYHRLTGIEVTCNKTINIWENQRLALIELRRRFDKNRSNLRGHNPKLKYIDDIGLFGTNYISFSESFLLWSRIRLPQKSAFAAILKAVGLTWK